MNKIHKINKKPPPIATLNSKNLLSIEGMNKLEINSLLDRADYFADLHPLKIKASARRCIFSKKCPPGEAPLLNP